MSNRLGTAEWADPQTVATTYQFQNGKFWLGRSPNEGAPLGYLDDRHICLVSGSRGGKGTTTIINNLCLWPGSLVVVDPKGENASITAARRGKGSEYCEGMGQSVHVLDPFDAATVDPSIRGRFNPLDALDPNHEETPDEAGSIADALVVFNPNSSDDTWDKGARTIIKGLILHVLTASEFEGRRNLITVRELITRGDVKAVAVLQSLGEDNIATGHALLWEGLRRNESFHGIIAGVGETYGNMAVNAPKQFEGYLSKAIEHTEFIDSAGMRRCLETSNFRLADLKTRAEGMSLYLSLPQRYMNTHYGWLRMIIGLIVAEMEKVRAKPATGHPVLMCLDEFAGLKRMEVIEKSIAQIAGHGAKLFVVLQSLEQLKGTYKDHWETFLSNCGLKIFFSIEDQLTRKYVSEMIGETEVVREVRSESTSDSTSDGGSRSTAKSKSENTTESTSQTAGRSGGTNASRNRNTGNSEGMSWRQFLLFFRKDKQYNEGRNSSEGSSEGSNRGWSDSTTAGLAKSLGFTLTETETTTYQKTHQSTAGTAETIHKRPLITPDEIGKLFARIDDKQHQAYPGMALVLISGQDPVALRRVNYYEDPYFSGLYLPHPDHPMLGGSQNSAIDLEIQGPIELAWGYLSGLAGGQLQVQWLVNEGQIVKKNDPVARLCGPDGSLKDIRNAVVCAPESGVLKRHCLKTGHILEYPGGGASRLGIIRSTKRQISSEWHIPQSFPIYDELAPLVVRRDKRSQLILAPFVYALLTWWLFCAYDFLTGHWLRAPLFALLSLFLWLIPLGLFGAADSKEIENDIAHHRRRYSDSSRRCSYY